MTENPTGVIEITQRIEAPPEIVFSYLTDSARFIQWMGVGAELGLTPGPIPMIEPGLRLDKDTHPDTPGSVGGPP